MTENRYPPIQIAFDQFGEVAKLAAMQELKIRLLANKTHGIEDSAYEHSVSEANKKIIEHYKNTKDLTDGNAELLQKSQTIRNKILHGEFNEAVKRIESLAGAPAPGPSIKVLKFDPNIGGKDLLDLISSSQKSMADGTDGPHLDAAKMKDQDLGIFGGLLNCVQTGAMKMAYDIFINSNTVLDNLLIIQKPTSPKSDNPGPTSKKDDK